MTRVGAALIVLCITGLICAARGTTPPPTSATAPVAPSPAQEAWRAARAAEAQRTSDEALKLHQQAQQMAQAENQPRLAALAANNQAVVWLRKGDPAKAVNCVREFVDTA